MNNNIGSFLLVFAVGFGLGFLFFRKKEGAAKWIAGAIGGLTLPTILYLTVPCSGSACPPSKSFSDMLANFGFGSSPTTNSVGGINAKGTNAQDQTPTPPTGGWLWQSLNKAIGR